MRHILYMFALGLAACGSKPPAQPAAPEPPKAPSADATPTSAATAEPDVIAAPATAKYFLGRMALPNGVPLKLLVTVSGDTATLDVPLQGLKAGALSEVQVSDATLAFVFLPPGAPATAANRFKAEKQADGAWVGTVAIGDLALPTRFTSVAGPEAMVANRPQTPKPPLDYQTEELRVASGDVSLGCTLALPKTPGPYGAVIFLSGSGVQDRDETIFDHKPFLVISDALAKAGVASVRCDDRGSGQSGGDPQSADAATFVADAEAVLAALRKRPEIHPERIGFFGHSEGGMTAAALAKKADNQVAFVVTMAGPAQTGRQILVRQNRDLILEQGGKADAAGAIEKAVDAYFGAIVAATTPDDAAVKSAAKGLAETVNGAVEGPASAEQSVSALTSNFEGLARQKWLKGFLSATPAADLAAAKVPTLALFGEKDVQVRAPENAAALEAAFEGIRDVDLTIKVVTGANHLFQDAATGALAEYDEIEQTIAESTLALMVDWIAKHVGARP